MARLFPNMDPERTSHHPIGLLVIYFEVPDGLIEEMWMRLLIVTLVATFQFLRPALANDPPPGWGPGKEAAYAAFRVVTKCAVTTAAKEKDALTLQSFRTLYIKLCSEPERDFLSKFVGSPADKNVRVANTAQGARMINEMVKQAFEKTRKLRGG